MDIYEYIKQKKELYNTLIEFLDAETKSSINDYKILRTTFQNIKQMKDQKEIKSLFHLIIQISHNDFFNDKIDEIVNYISDTIKQIMTNSEIFNIFKSNKRILLFLIQSKTLICYQLTYQQSS